MLSQIKVYFITVTVIIFVLVVVRIFNNRVKEFGVILPSIIPNTGSENTNKTEERYKKDDIKPTNNVLQYLMGGNGVNDKTKTESVEASTKPEIVRFFPLYKHFMGKSLAFETENQNPYLKEEQYNFYQKSILNGALNITKIAITRFHTNETSHEMQQLIGQPLNTVKDLGDEIQSEFVLLNSSNSNVFYVGDIVAVRVDVFSTFKVPCFIGGDEVRVWIKDQSKGVSMAVEVEDLRNGSYVARLPLLLPGNVTIFANLAYPKEILKSIFFLRVIMGSVRLAAGGFVSRAASYCVNDSEISSISEATLCSPFPIDYDGHGLCNLTNANFDRPWFCGKPRNPNLSCDHWNETRDLEFPYPLPVGQAEQDWLDMISLGKKHYLRALQDSVIRIKVVRRKEVKSLGPSKPYCGNRLPRETWTETAPRGMFYKMSWVPFGCRLKLHSFHTLKKALEHHTLYLIGDSNLLSWVDIFQKNDLCNLIKNPIDKITGRAKLWHDPTDCYNDKYNLAIRWRTHGLPFHSNPDHWASRINLQSAATTLDLIPAANKTIILIHLFMHFSTQHYSVFLDRVRATRDAVQRLLERNPSIKVFIRGPHVAYKEWPASLGGDAQGPLFRQILRDEFYELYDKVYLLDFWDMTVAGENKAFHPTVFITLQMIDLFFGYIIDK